MKKTIVLMIALIILLSVSAVADIPGFEYGTSNSWTLSTGENGWYTNPTRQFKFDHLAFQLITPGLTFENVGWTELSVKPGNLAGTLYYDPSWHQIANTGRSLIAAGNPVNLSNTNPYPYMYFEFTFNGNQVSPATMYWQLWEGDKTATFLTTFTNTSNGGFYTQQEVTMDRIAVPEPMSIMLGIMGLGSIAGYRRLRRK